MIETPDDGMKSELVRFRRTTDGSGEYEDLYSYSEERDMMVTLPGFAARIMRRCGPDDRIRDMRVKLPEPDISASMNGTPDIWQSAWHGIVESAVSSGGGIVSVPDILGTSGMAAAIIRAFPRERLLDRGTPICLVAADDSASARALAYELRQLLPGREVGISAGGAHTDSEDVVVSSYGTMKDVMLSAVGIFIGVVGSNLKDSAEARRAEAVSSVRNAARWGIVSTPIGGHYDPNMAEEGLFGPLCASASYDDAVKAGVGRPITVVWLPCPKPMAPELSAPLYTLEKMAHADNPEFVRMVADMFKSSGKGMLLSANRDLSSAMRKAMPDTVAITREMREKERKTTVADVSSGTIRKAVIEPDFFPSKTDHVIVASSCYGFVRVPLKSDLR